MSNVITLANSMGDVLGKFPRNFMQFGPPCEQAEYFDFLRVEEPFRRNQFDQYFGLIN